MKKIICCILIGLLIGLSISVYASPVELISDIKGEMIKLFNKDGNLNVKLGVASTTADNKGGTLILYSEAPNNKDVDDYIRVGLGIRKVNDSGILQLRNNEGFLNTWLTTDDGYIANSRIITEQIMNNQGYVKKSDVQKIVDEAIKKYIQNQKK